jgi:hypothetical protein
VSEEHRLRVFENRVLRKVFGPDKQTLEAEWRILNGEELYSLYCSLNVIAI